MSREGGGPQKLGLLEPLKKRSQRTSVDLLGCEGAEGPQEEVLRDLRVTVFFRAVGVEVPHPISGPLSTERLRILWGPGETSGVTH